MLSRFEPCYGKGLNHIHAMEKGKLVELDVSCYSGYVSRHTFLETGVL